ncbi:ABC transporter ATP-binding protein [Virgibacillus flavescens]|uniref:ABC transporter ATP-binding protein n=1 Tax=Virgibacillus flavescens TaxID=1611422 RepID=UPI003D340E39
MLNVTALSKTYGNHKILNSLTFSVSPGEIVGLVGENGAGKSTILKILSTLSKPSAGSISLYNNDYDNNSKGVKQSIGYVPQEIACWEDFTVQENMLFFEKLSTVKKTDAELRQLCVDMKLSKWKEPVKLLSGGMKRKLNLAISLIHDPEVLLLDEPTVGIDLKSKNEISGYIKNLATKKNVMVLFTSHDMDEIIHLCDRILCIGDDSFYLNHLTDAGVNPIRL